jgi:curved DNA-binding protein CbpA
MTYDELKQALLVLGLSGRPTMKEIRTRHRQLVKRYHPDAGDGSDPEAIRRVNEAYRTVSEYVSAYRYDFSEAEFYIQNPEEHLRRQFAGDAIWGNR